MVRGPFEHRFWPILRELDARRRPIPASPESVTALPRNYWYSPPSSLGKVNPEVTHMKLNRLIAASIVGISLLAPSTSAFACDHDSHSSWSWFGFCNHTDHDRDCDHDRNSGGHDCNHGGSSSGGSSSGGSSSGGSSNGGGSNGGGSNSPAPPSTGPKG